jgi:hypothetical protein
MNCRSHDSDRLDNDATSYNIVLNAFSLSFKHFNIKSEVNQKPIVVTHY